MKKSDFFYDLPQELIAQTPIERRELSRLLCMDRTSGRLEHRQFFELPELLREGDVLVLNDSRVMPARLLGTRESGGAAEIVLLREAQSSVKPPSATTWLCLVRPGRKIRTGTKLFFGNGELTAVITGETEGGNRLIKFSVNSEAPHAASGGPAPEPRGSFLEILEKLGKMPLPPYIHEELEDSERYQTVYSRVTGSAAAPTAGLHFTDELLCGVKARGAEVCFITLHVGLGTFRPVKADEIERHDMHAEYFIIPGETAEKVNSARANGRRVIAVGTTSCRALESCADEAGIITPYSGFTEIFIYPGYKFKCIDGLITNFHLPESTLIMLVSAFSSLENVLNAYRAAIDERYRFFSFGDAMLIV